MGWLFGKDPEIRQQAAKYGFGDVEAVVSTLGPRIAAPAISTSEAGALVRRFALERPDLLKPGATATWTPAELAEVHQVLMSERRVPEAVEWRAKHREQLAVADGVQKRLGAEREARVDAIKGRLWAIEQDLGNGLVGRRGELRAAEGKVRELQGYAVPWMVREQLEASQARAERLRGEVQQLEQQAEAARAELTQAVQPEGAAS